jgi:hypothetical protein
MLKASGRHAAGLARWSRFEKTLHDHGCQSHVIHLAGQGSGQRAMMFLFGLTTSGDQEKSAGNCLLARSLSGMAHEPMMCIDLVSNLSSAVR